MDRHPPSARIRIGGFRPPVVRPGRHRRRRRVALVRPLNWIGPLGAAGILQGTPHVLFASRTSGYGAYRYYDDCAYAALDGRMAHTSGWSCPWFRLMREGR